MTWYSTGTVSVTNGSAVVTGAGTAFVANVLAGHGLSVPGQSTAVAEILAVNADGQLTLRKPWAGASGSGLEYTIIPTDSPGYDFYSRLSQLLNGFSAVRDTVGQGLFPGGSPSAPGLRFVNDPSSGFTNPAAGAVGIVTGGVERMRLAGPDLGVGTLVPAARLHALQDFGAGGPFVFRAALVGESSYTRSDNGQFVSRRLAIGSVDYSAAMQATDTNSNIVSLCINPYGGNVSVGTSLAKDALTVSGTIAHAADNVSTFGTPSYRAAGIYLGSSPSVTSDARDKRLRANEAGVRTGELTAAEIAAARQIADEIVIYQYEEAIAAKGEQAARWHCGVEAQTVVEILTAHGLDWQRYSFIGHDSWDASPGMPAQPAAAEVLDDNGNILMPGRPAMPAVPARAAGDRFNVRYDGIVMFVARAQEQRLRAIDAQLAA